MNILIILAVVLCGGTILTDHLIHKVPHTLAVVLYTAGVALFVIGMIVSRRAGA